jgi:hypothetical protein
MDIVNKLIKKIKKEKDVDISNNIEIDKKTIILQNNDVFDFGSIFVIDLRKSGLQNTGKFMPIGTSEDNNIHVCAEYCDIFLNYYVVYNEKKDTFTLFPITC